MNVGNSNCSTEFDSHPAKDDLVVVNDQRRTPEDNSINTT